MKITYRILALMLVLAVLISGIYLYFVMLGQHQASAW